MNDYVDDFWPDLKSALGGGASVSSHSIVFQNVVILVLNVSQELPERTNVQELRQWIADEDESKQVRLSIGLKVLKIRSNKQKSISVKNVTIVRKDEDEDDAMDDLPLETLQINTSCFKITFVKQIDATCDGHKNPDTDNIITCYHNVFYECLKNNTQVNERAFGTDARVRDVQVWNFCASKDKYVPD